MTLTTHTTTRKAPWAAVLTALLAVVALVFGAMALAGPANAKDDNPNKPDNPGNSQNAPGHDEDALPPGQDDDFVPPGQQDRPNTEKKIWICHADANNGKGNTNLGVEGPNGLGTGGEAGVGFNLIYISVNAWENSHDKLHENDYPATGAEIAQGFCGTQTTPTPASLCDLTAVPPAMTTFADNTSAAYLAALADAQAATHTRYALTCPTTPPPPVTPPTEVTPEQAAAIDAALAATVPEPETVAPVLPAKVAVPTPANVSPAPATVPAGDGSSVPQAPVALLTLLAAATAGAVASGLRLAMNR